jgi:hypothetical protein
MKVMNKREGQVTHEGEFLEGIGELVMSYSATLSPYDIAELLLQTSMVTLVATGIPPKEGEAFLRECFQDLRKDVAKGKLSADDYFDLQDRHPDDDDDDEDDDGDDEDWDEEDDADWDDDDSDWDDDDEEEDEMEDRAPCCGSKKLYASR